MSWNGDNAQSFSLYYRKFGIGRPRPETLGDSENSPKYGMHNKKYGATISDVLDWFKTMTTNEYVRGVKQHNWQRFDKKLWQRGAYDHIIRNMADYSRIANYIINNPEKWDNDKFNKNE